MYTNSNNYLDLSAYAGQRICMIFINNNLRHGTTLNHICKRFRIQHEDVNVFNSHFFTGCPDLRHVTEVVNAYPNDLETFIYQPRLQRAAHEPHPGNLNFQGGVRGNRLDVNYLFPNQGPLKRGIPVSPIIAQRHLPTPDEVAEYRSIGDSHLKLICLRHLKERHVPAAALDELITDARMRRFIVDFVGGEAFIQSIYGGDGEIGDLACANVFQAMFELLFLSRSPIFATLTHRFLRFEQNAAIQ